MLQIHVMMEVPGQPEDVSDANHECCEVNCRYDIDGHDASVDLHDVDPFNPNSHNVIPIRLVQ